MNGPLDRLVRALKHLPGVGEKTATRFAFHLLNADDEDVLDLVSAIRDVKRTLKLCSICHQLTDADPCAICSDPKRDASRICVVESYMDLMSIEKAGLFRGKYHVLHGVLSPLDAVGPEDIRLGELFKRADKNEIKEIILALNPTVEGESTASYIAEKLKRTGIKISRIAYGIPVGGSLEYADPLTVSRALENRKEY